MKAVGTEKLKKGDVITFRLGGGDELATHRIIEVMNENGELKFRTQGDANDVADPTPVDASNVVGKVLFNIPSIGYAYKIVGTQKGRALAFCLVVLTVMLLLRELFPKKKKQSA